MKKSRVRCQKSDTFTYVFPCFVLFFLTSEIHRDVCELKVNLL